MPIPVFGRTIRHSAEFSLPNPVLNELLDESSRKSMPLAEIDSSAILGSGDGHPLDAQTQAGHLTREFRALTDANSSLWSHDPAFAEFSLPNPVLNELLDEHVRKSIC
jgi:hypothetical protein